MIRSESDVILFVVELVVDLMQPIQSYRRKLVMSRRDVKRTLSHDEER
jgi:flagellar biosynthesis protein FlhB